MADCILFLEDGTTKKMSVKADQRAINLAARDGLHYIGYDIRHFMHKNGSDGIIYLIACIEQIDDGVIIDAINEHRPQPIELKQLNTP